MKNLVFSILCLIALNSSGQYGLVSYKKFNGLSNLKTLVPLFGSEEFNEKYKEAINKHWTYSEVLFIPNKDLKKYLADDNYTIILPIRKEVRQTYSTGAQRVFGSNYLTFVRSGRKKVRHYNYNRWCGSVLYDEDMLDYTIELTISALNHVLFVMEQEKFTGRYRKIGNKFRDYYKTKTKEIEDGELFVREEFVDKSLKRKEIPANKYAFKLNIVEEYLEKVFEPPYDNKFYVSLVPSLNVMQITIYNLSTKEVVYFEYSRGFGFRQFDEGILKDISRLID